MRFDEPIKLLSSSREISWQSTVSASPEFVGSVDVSAHLLPKSDIVTESASTCASAFKISDI